MLMESVAGSPWCAHTAAERGKKPILALIFQRIDEKSIHVGKQTLEVIASMDVEKLSNLLRDLHENPFMADLSIAQEEMAEVTLPPTSIQHDVDSGGWFGRSGRVERRGLARSRSLSAASDPVAG